MKKFWIGWIAIAAGISASAQVHSMKNLTGRWINNDGGGIEIIDSSQIFLVYGKERKPVISYTTDFSRSPAWFDFVVRDGTNNLSVKSLLLLQDGKVLKWQVFEDGNRPNNFAPERGNVMVLRKKRMITIFPHQEYYFQM